MSASMSQMFQAQLLSSSLNEETKLVQKQGILTIMGSENRASVPSLRLRRTLSADMSSKKWLSQNGFAPMKRISSSEELSQSKRDDHDDNEHDEQRKDLEQPGQFDIWSSIQRDKNKEQEKPERFDIWSSIISPKANEEDASKSLPPPYVHPLVKRSQSSLSKKSLEICTESLGSETGSDVLSSYPPFENGDAVENKEEEQQEQKVEVEAHEAEEDDFEVPKYNYTASAKKSSLSRSFPPPLPSLSCQDGPSLHMRYRRDNGRIVLEAVSVPPQNNFCTQRQDGRLVLTFANQQSKEDDAADAEVIEDSEKDETEEELEEEFEGEDTAGNETVIEQTTILSSGITGLALMMNKPIGLVNSDPNWSEKLVNNRSRVARLISSSPAAMASAASFNVYEYYWRTKPSSTPNQLALQQNNNSKFIVSEDINQISNERQQLVVLRGKNGDYLVHNLKSCKESRRSFLFWEPYCIATS